MRQFLWRVGYFWRKHIYGRYASWRLHRQILNGTAPRGRTTPQ